MEEEGFKKKGEDALRKRDYALAVRMFSAALEHEPSNSNYSNRAFAYFNLKQFGEAVADYLEAIKFARESADKANHDKNFKLFNEWLISLAMDQRCLALSYNALNNFKETVAQCGLAITLYETIRDNSYPIRGLDISELYTISAFGKLCLKNREGAVSDFAMACVEAKRAKDEVALKNITQQVLLFGLQKDVAKAFSVLEMRTIKREEYPEEQPRKEEIIYLQSKPSFEGETRNTIFQDMSLYDVENFFAVYNDKTITKYLKQQHFTEEEISERFKELMLYQHVNLEILTSIFCKTDNAFAGLIRVDLFKPIEDSISNPWIRDPVSRITTGCKIEAVYILEKHQNSSFVSEVFPLLLEYLKSIGIIHVFTETVIHNIAAKKVLEKYQFEKVDNPDFKNMHIPLTLGKFGPDAVFFYKSFAKVN